MKRIFAMIAMSLIVALLPLQASAFETSANDFLLGTWSHKKVQQVADGKLVRTAQAVDGSTVEFKRDGTWTLSSTRNHSSGTYRWLASGSLETTTVGSDISNQIGWVSVKQVQVDSKSLRLTTVYDERGMIAFKPKTDGSGLKEMIVTSTFERVVPK